MPDPDSDRDRLPIPRIIRLIGEAVLVCLGTLAAWPFGCVETFWEMFAGGGVLLLAALWFSHALAIRQLRFKPDPVSIGLATLVFVSVVQLVPLPLGVVGVLSPGRAELHRTLVPDELERLPGEADARTRPDWLPLSVEPHATRTLAVRLLAVFVVYAAARNWLASRDALRRFAWAALANGVALALLALTQYFSSPHNVAYWTVDTGSVIFGPFICRNHFPDFVGGCAGLTLGVMLTRDSRDKKPTEPTEPGSFVEQLVDVLRSPVELLKRPVQLAAAGAVALMMVSVVFSLSRGGLLAFLAAVIATWLVSRWAKPAVNGLTGWAVTLVVAAVLALVVWLGWKPLEERYKDSWTSTAANDRVPLWLAGLKQVPATWLTGTGGGTFQRVEPIHRTAFSPGIVYEHAHNEFVEAVVEGGVVRLGVTLVVVGWLLVGILRRYRSVGTNSTGPLVLGGFFALVLLVAHAVTDFALHIPAIALFAAVVAGYTVAAIRDPGYTQIRIRTRKGTARLPVDTPPAATGMLTGWPVLLAGSLLVLAAAVGLLDSVARHRADLCRAGADALRGSTHPAVLAKRIDYQTARTQIVPLDPTAWSELARVHLDAAVAKRTGETFPADVVKEHIIPAVRALQTSRDLCPLLPEVHARLGANARHFAHSEPAIVHYERANRLTPGDPELLFALGQESLLAGLTDTAVDYWKQSLERSPRQLKAILHASAALPPTSLDRLLPDDPVVLVGAADELFPDRRNQSSRRKPYLERAVATTATMDDVRRVQAVAAACDELDRPAVAEAAWKVLLDAMPSSADARDGFARWLERDERYAEAVPHLEWLEQARPTDPGVRTRLSAARHGVKLNDILSK